MRSLYFRLVDRVGRTFYWAVCAYGLVMARAVRSYIMLPCIIYLYGMLSCFIYMSSVLPYVVYFYCMLPCTVCLYGMLS